MFTRRKLEAQLCQELLEALTEGGQRDLSQLRLDNLETEVYDIVDRVSQRTLCGVLEDQAAVSAAEMKACPQCGGDLVDKPSKEKTLTAQRGEIKWLQPVKRCTACRCDFFPSGPSAGN